MKRRSVVVVAMVIVCGVLFAPVASGATLPTMGKHVCHVIGGVWTRSTSTCEIAGTGTVSNSFKLTSGQTVLVDQGATLNIAASGYILDLAGTDFGIVNNGTVNNVGTINNDGSFDGAVINNSTGTFNNSGGINFGYQNYGQVANAGTFNNAGYLQAWDMNDSGTLTNTFDLTLDQTLYIGAGGLLDNSGSISAQWKTWIDVGGTITNESSGTFQSLNGSNTSFDNAGSLDNFGSFTNDGAFLNEADGTVTNESGANLNNNDSIDNFGAVTNSGTISDLCTATFTNESGSSYSGNTVATSC